MNTHPSLIETAFEQRSSLTPENASPLLKEAIAATIQGLETSLYRVAEKINSSWQVHSWLKKAILLYFRLHPNQIMAGTITQFYDKVPLRFSNLSEAEFAALGIRVVPPAFVRHGAYVAANTILMPSYTNIGAYIDSGTMIDSWATVGSAAQIGKNVHISAGVCIGGVLEPIQCQPTIIEDDCFIGANSAIVEGVIVERGSVIAMGVCLGQSTRIYDRHTQQISYGRIPAGSVVVPGSIASKNKDYQLNCAIIVKTVDDLTRAKVSINELLREAAL